MSTVTRRRTKARQSCPSQIKRRITKAFSTTLPGSSGFKDYSLEFHCHNGVGAFRNGAIVLKGNQ